MLLTEDRQVLCCEMKSVSRLGKRFMALVGIGNKLCLTLPSDYSGEEASPQEHVIPLQTLSLICGCMPRGLAVS